jgi:hypothetical protein
VRTGAVSVPQPRGPTRRTRRPARTPRRRRPSASATPGRVPSTWWPEYRVLVPSYSTAPRPGWRTSSGPLKRGPSDEPKGPVFIANVTRSR